MVRILAAFLALILLFALFALGVYQVWGPVGLLIVTIGGIFSLVLLRYFAGMMIQRAFTAPFVAKGAVLRDATVQVHSVTAAAPPAPVNPAAGEAQAEGAPGAERSRTDGDEATQIEGEVLGDQDEGGHCDTGEDAVPRAWYWIEATITPAPGHPGPFHLWEPGELAFASEAARPSPGPEDDSGYTASPSEIQVWGGSDWVADEGMKYQGEQRLRLLAGLPPQWRAARFRYYFEVFGEVPLPRAE
jgi:hypothetical protein